MWLMKEKSKTKTERTNELQWGTRILMAIEMRLVTQTNKQTKKTFLPLRAILDRIRPK